MLEAAGLRDGPVAGSGRNDVRPFDPIAEGHEGGCNAPSSGIDSCSGGVRCGLRWQRFRFIIGNIDGTSDEFRQ
jgi:hypothetical protein